MFEIFTPDELQLKTTYIVNFSNSASKILAFFKKQLVNTMF